MILRQFLPDDWSVIQQHQYPNLSETEIREMISQWNTCQHDSRYFEMLAIENDCNIVGFVSLFEQDDSSVSEGIEIYGPYRRQGFACMAVTELIQRAKHLGFTTVTAQVRQDNTASLALHEKLGFQIIDSVTNNRGYLVYALSKKL